MGNRESSWTSNLKAERDGSGTSSSTVLDPLLGLRQAAGHRGLGWPRPSCPGPGGHPGSRARLQERRA